MNELDEKIKKAFPGECVHKSKDNSSIFEGMKIPSFVKDYLIQRFSDSDGKLDKDRLLTFLEEHVPKKKDSAIKQMISDQKEVTLLTRILVEPDIGSGEYKFELPEMGIKKGHSLIPNWLIKKHDELTLDEVWGVISLARIETEGRGRIEVTNFKPFKPYITDLEYYRSRRKQFSLDEWIDLLIRSMEYNPEGFDSLTQKLLFISRLLVFAEPNLNLVELAPKGTGKSYIFQNLTKYGWLISGGVVTRAKLFYDVGRSSRGLIMRYDFIAMDEAQTIKFSNDMEVAAGLKSYLESGKFTIAKNSEQSDASFILLGNIYLDGDKTPKNKKYFSSLPKIFNESALLDRLHGFIEGWKLPRINEDLIVKGYSLNVEYFSEILHLLRTESKYNSIVDFLLDVPPRADTRDTKAIKKICSGYLKLLFPHITSEHDISREDFQNYCLRPAMKMRRIIREQMHVLDTEYGPDVPDIKVRQ